MDDQQLLEGIRAGINDKALVKLYRFLPPVGRMIRYYGGSTQEAEDVFQEALIILCRKARQEALTLRSGIYPYLYSVCRHLWSEELRQRGRHRTSGLDEDGEAYAGAAGETSFEEEQRYRQAEKIVSGLGDRCRELLLLFYEGRVKLREIAARMGYSSEQSAKNQKYKCLEAARKAYRQQVNLNSL